MTTIPEVLLVMLVKHSTVELHMDGNSSRIGRYCNITVILTSYYLCRQPHNSAS